MLDLVSSLAPNYASNEVGELAASLDETLGRLRDTLKCEQLLASNVGHELRTPLMVITTSHELLAGEPSFDPHARGQPEWMTKTIREMYDLVQALLLLACAQEDEENLVPHGSLESIADDLVQVQCEQVGTRGLVLHYRNEGACVGQFNASLLHAVTGNLLRNATYYTGAGSITLTLDECGFSVENTGTGVPEEQHERIFIPFVRGSSSSRRSEGLGLGLPLVKRICAAESWSVTLSTVEPHSCRFEALPDVA